MKQRAKLHFVLHGCVREESTFSPLPLSPSCCIPRGLQKCFFVAQGEELAVLARTRRCCRSIE